MLEGMKLKGSWRKVIFLVHMAARRIGFTGNNLYLTQNKNLDLPLPFIEDNLLAVQQYQVF